MKLTFFKSILGEKIINRYSDFPRFCKFSDHQPSNTDCKMKTMHAQTGWLRPRAACDSQAAQITVEGNEE